MRIAVVFNDDAGALAVGEEKDRVAVAAAASAALAVAQALAARGHLTVAIPVRGDICEAAATLAAARPDAIFNACEAFAGDSRREGAFAGFLDLLGVPVTGSPPATLYLAQDKERAKAVLRAAGVRTAPGGVLARPDAPLPPGLRWPLFLKTRYEDASHGIAATNLCESEAALRARAAELHAAYRQDLLVEEFLPGREIYASILDGELLPLGEIDYGRLAAVAPGRPPIVTYDAKWVESSPDYQGTPVIAADLPGALADEVHGLARAAFHALGCRGYARVDLRLDRDGRPVVLEVNPNPDISPDAGFARAAARAGIDYERLIERIVEVARAAGHP